VLVQVETPPVLVSSLITPSVTGDNVKRPFSPSDIDSAHAARIPPKQYTAATTATAEKIFENDVGFIMKVLRRKRIEPRLSYTCER
jgi:hypothetical protein